MTQFAIELGVVDKETLNRILTSTGLSTKEHKQLRFSALAWYEQTT